MRRPQKAREGLSRSAACLTTKAYATSPNHDAGRGLKYAAARIIALID